VDIQVKMGLFSGALGLTWHAGNVEWLFTSPVCTRYWVTPSFGKSGQTNSSMHKFAATPPIPDLSRPLESMNFSGFNDAL